MILLQTLTVLVHTVFLFDILGSIPTDIRKYNINKRSIKHGQQEPVDIKVSHLPHTKKTPLAFIAYHVGVTAKNRLVANYSSQIRSK